MTPSGYYPKSRYFLPWSISLCLHLGILMLLLPLAESKKHRSHPSLYPTPPPLRLLSAKDAQRLIKKDAKEKLAKPAQKPNLVNFNEP